MVTAAGGVEHRIDHSLRARLGGEGRVHSAHVGAHSAGGQRQGRQAARGARRAAKPRVKVLSVALLAR